MLLRNAEAAVIQGVVYGACKGWGAGERDVREEYRKRAVEIGGG